MEHALELGAEPTLAWMRTQATAKSFEGLSARDPAEALPASLKAERISTAVSEDKKRQSAFFRQFRAWKFSRKLARAQALATDFRCEDGLEAQALGHSLEIDFPEAEAITISRTLHEKILDCPDVSKAESLFKLAVFAIHKGECSQATKYLDQFSGGLERGVSDRLSYLRGFCGDERAVKARNPWGGYGILLTDKWTWEEPPVWTLTATSGSEDWDRLLVSFVELQEKGKHQTVRYLAGKLNYESLQTLPLSFQTSLLVLMSFSGADLSVFQALHRYLASNPEKSSPAVSGLLFPIRYWQVIVDNSKSTDPVLVKSLIRQESAFNPLARSRARAAGLMQMIYPTARRYGIKQRKDLLKPEKNIQAGSEFLGQLLNEFGSPELALAAYNAGPGIVRQWRKRYPTDNIDLFVEMIPYSETREYVRLVQRNYKIYQSLLIKTQTLGGN